MLRGVRQQVAVLVNRAALDRQILTPKLGQRGFQSRRPVDDHELGPRQAAGIEIAEEAGPCRRAFAAFDSKSEGLL